MTDDSDPLGLVAMLMASQSQLDLMLSQHERDTEGRCRTCRQGPTGAGRTIDCTLGSAARAAKRRLAES